MPADTKANTVETYQFQAEVKKVLDIVIHSLYTEREIFVRELISNAADALEKFRHESLVHKQVFDEHLSLEISITMDEKEHTLTISDVGIGMTHDELITNLGSIAHSGAHGFLNQLAETARHPAAAGLLDPEIVFHLVGVFLSVADLHPAVLVHPLPAGSCVVFVPLRSHRLYLLSSGLEHPYHLHQLPPIFRRLRKLLLLLE